MEIIIVKQTDERLSEHDAVAVRRFLFEYVDGCNDKDKRAWRGWWKALVNAGSGEYFSISIKRQRSGKFHRLVMAVMQSVFKAQERFDDFRVFRAFLKLGAGFVDYVPDAKTGELKAHPKSQSFDECSEEEVRQFFSDAVDFLRSRPAQSVLWPDISPDIADRGINELLQQFERF